MTPELISAIKERIAIGKTRSQIQEEVLATGYTLEVYMAAYEAALANSKTEDNNFTPNVVLEENKIIGYKELILSSWQLAALEYKIFIKTITIALIFFVLSGGLVYLLTQLPNLNSFEIFIIVACILPALGFLIILYSSFAILRALLVRKTAEHFRGHLGWVAKNLVQLSLASLYFTCIVQTGYLLFILPGIIASIYLLFTNALVVSGRERGMAALAASTQMVHGRFFPVLGRFLVANLGIGLLLCVSLLLNTSFFFFLPLVLIVGVPLTLFCLYWLLCSFVVLYESLLSLPPAEPLPLSLQALKKIYITIVSLVLVGLVFSIAAFAIVFAYFDTSFVRAMN